MKVRNLRFLLATALLIGVIGSAGTVFAHGGPSPGLTGNPYAPSRDAKITLDAAGRLALVEQDTNGDGRFDLFNHFESGRLARQESDRNGDGAIDYWLYVDAGGRPFRGEMDGDFDGKIDTDEEYREGVVVRQRVDTDHNGLFDVSYHGWAGSLTLIEQDTNADGRFDKWTYFTAERNELSILEDRDFDGFPETRARVIEGRVVMEAEPQIVPAAPIEEELPPEESLEAVTVTERPALTAASDATIRDRDFRSFPHMTPSDMVRLVPGIHVSQHTGGAKAYQYFLRGFDAEHGQDLAAFVDGIPLNEPSQVHGHGYLDLHFLIPETVAAVRILKGPYDPEFGNFATAGAVDFIPRRSATENAVSATAGMFGTARVYAGGGWSSDPYIGTAALETDHTDGFTDPGWADAVRGHQSQTWIFGRWSLSTWSHHYGQRSAATDVIPAAWVEDGKIDRFGSMDPSDAVFSNRHLVAASLEYHDPDDAARLQAWFDYKRAAIWSNFTYYLLDPVRGDQQEQLDNRGVFGAQGRWQHTFTAGRMAFVTAAGAQWRRDRVHQILANARDRARFNVIDHLEFSEDALGAWVREEAVLAPWVTLVPGARFDTILYRGDGTLDERYFNIYTNQADTRQDVPTDWNETASIVSPKASAIFTPVRDWNLFLNYGEGFFSNTSLQMAKDPQSTIPKVKGGEAGTRVWAWGNRFTFGGSFWYADKDSDLVFDPQTGVVSTKAKTKRHGVDGEVRLSPWKPLYLATDASFIDARFVDTGNRIPNGPIFLMTNAVGLADLRGWRGMIRGRYMGSRELDQRDWAEPYYVTDLVAGYDTDRWGVELAIDNIFDVEWRDAEFSYETRPEPNGSTINGEHYTPGVPFFARAMVTAKF